jgi:hypothetical protein
VAWRHCINCQRLLVARVIGGWQAKWVSLAERELNLSGRLRIQTPSCRRDLPIASKLARLAPSRSEALAYLACAAANSAGAIDSILWASEAGGR